MELDSGMHPLNLHALLTPAQAHPSYRDAHVTDATEKKKSAENVTSALTPKEVSFGWLQWKRQEEIMPG